MLEQVRNQVLPAMEKNGPVVAWIIDDTGCLPASWQQAASPETRSYLFSGRRGCSRDRWLL
jgi:hypothetical protein